MKGLTIATLLLGRNMICIFCIVIMFGGCREKVDTLFTLMPSSHTGIHFSNNVVYSESQNPYTNHGFYNGGGVAVGDINNDGLPDLFFTSSQGQNRLYLNKGNFEFEDITNAAWLHLDGMWCTGAVFVDVNGDGLLDLYVCRSFDYKAGMRGNLLYINNGNLTFTERAGEFGLADQGISTQAVFFDYDNDGDLDCYLLTNSRRPVGVGYDLIKNQRMSRNDSVGGNKLFRNDGGHFTDVTNSAGIYSSSIGFGLGVTVADINKDGWPDIYVSNDFFERDYLYINNKDGTFTECLDKYIREISMFSMGADIADINNDGYPEIFVTDMLPEDETRIKTKTNFENWDKYQADLKNGYYQQFTRNVLQLNRGPVVVNDSIQYYFSEIARMANVHASDWSWAALIADLDNDGYKDIFVANGMYKDVTDQDFIQSLGRGEVRSMKQAVDSLSSTPLVKFAFHNNGNLTFTNKAKEWGLSEMNFSNGSVYVDLDNDGDLDLVTNNLNSEASVYRNNAETVFPKNQYLKVALEGEGLNRYGVGAKVTVFHDGGLNYQEEMPARGFQSCVDTRLNFGLGETKKIDSVTVDWPGGKMSVLKDVIPGQTITIKQSEAASKGFLQEVPRAGKEAVFKPANNNFGIDFKHKEDNYTDFDLQRLIFQMHSTEGPRLSTGDINGDGLQDFYVCGASGQPGALYVQTKDGNFIKTNQSVFQKDSIFEDESCVFFDADGDHDLDLLICSGGNEINSHANLEDRLYINDGKGNFTRSHGRLPAKRPGENSACVDAVDFDGDGNCDLFIGIRMIPEKYGYPCKAYILRNNGKGVFTDVTNELAPGLDSAGMITDGKWFDYDRDGKPDLVITGEYMPIRIFHNEGRRFREVTKEIGLENSNGWWNRIQIADLNNDGYPDIVVGNYGLNSRIKASLTRPASLYVNDFDGSGTTKQILCTYNGDKQYPVILRHDLVAVMPSLKKKLFRYADYKEKTIKDIFTSEQLSGALRLDAYDMNTSILLNDKKGGFVLKSLPAEAQMSPVYGMSIEDFNGDGKKDILLGGNFYQCKPELGINDASYGTLLLGDGKGNFTVAPMSQSGLCIKGAVRDIANVKCGTRNLVLIAKNNDEIQVLEY